MTQDIRSVLLLLRSVMQYVALVLIVTATIGLVGYTMASALGYAPWLSMPLSFGGTVFPQAGIAVQIALAVLALSLCFYLPANGRMMALEKSHRSFHIGMQDVAKAYHAAHAADRKGLFNLRSEFDSVRERIAFLREHPDLGALEPSVIEVAAQMSHLSRELATVYSDQNVARAKDFLLQRQHEIEAFTSRIDRAKLVTSELRVWIDKVEIEEAVADAQLARLCDELTSILPELPADTEEMLRQEAETHRTETPEIEIEHPAKAPQAEPPLRVAASVAAAAANDKVTPLSLERAAE
ncbi:DNA repair protein [Litorisediminicola beolgyonensis]|uniref:DNA repair protein n=1 Tax=Litorisediminicola beolgyonensis TaxID=1173614 RepID=A0ABW3ZEN4_9RHOB